MTFISSTYLPYPNSLYIFTFQISKVKAALFPVMGMVLGGAVAGPVGLAAGLKLGSVAAVSGGIIGKLIALLPSDICRDLQW